MEILGKRLTTRQLAEQVCGVAYSTFTNHRGDYEAHLANFYKFHKESYYYVLDKKIKDYEKIKRGRKTHEFDWEWLLEESMAGNSYQGTVKSFADWAVENYEIPFADGTVYQYFRKLIMKRYESVESIWTLNYREMNAEELKLWREYCAAYYHMEDYMAELCSAYEQKEITKKDFEEKMRLTAIRSWTSLIHKWQTDTGLGRPIKVKRYRMITGEGRNPWDK